MRTRIVTKKQPHEKPMPEVLVEVDDPLEALADLFGETTAPPETDTWSAWLWSWLGY